MAQIATVSDRSTPAQPGIGRRAAEEVVRPLLGGLLLLVALIGLIGTAIKNPQPHDIRIGIVGPAPAVDQISGAFESNAPGAFRFTSYQSEDAARAALDARSVDGALVLGGGGPRVIVAGAAGDTVTGVITGALTNAFRAQGQAVTVETVRPFASGDPHGLILFFVVLAVVISTLVAQALVGLRAGVGLGGQLVMLAAYAVLAPLVGMGTAAWIAGGYGSGFWTAVGLIGLASAAIGAVVAGSARLLGAAGVGLAALLVVLLDLVASGGPIGSQLLPDFYRWPASAMPAGQLYSAVRGALYFDNAGLGTPTAVLSAWLAGGLVLMALGELVARRRARTSRPAEGSVP
jgi:hypothetical protein